MNYRRIHDSSELLTGEIIVATTEFLRRNNGSTVLPETRPYRFNGKLNELRHLGGNPDSHAVDLEKLLAEGPGESDRTPSALEIRSNIAYWRAESGDPAGAMASIKELLPVLQ